MTEYMTLRFLAANRAWYLEWQPMAASSKPAEGRIRFDSSSELEGLALS